MSRVDVDELVARIKRERGTLTPMTLLLAELDPDFLDLFDRTLGHALRDEHVDGPHLERKHRELIMACVVAATAGPDPVIAAHFSNALEAGLSAREALDAIELVSLGIGGMGLMRGAQALIAARTGGDAASDA